MIIERIEHFLPYLERVRERTLRAAAPLTDEGLERPYAPGRFTAGDLLRHIAATERWMWAENVRGRPSRYPGHGTDLAAGKSAVMDYLERMHAEATEIFRSLSPEDLRLKCPTVAGVELTTWKWLRAMVEHEVHHRGQLYVVLSHLGVEAPPLYGLTEREVFRRSLQE